MRESRNLEFKQNITNTFLKTVSAFANYDGGTILFGVDDTGKTIGLDNPVQSCLDIETKINDSIKPVPEYRLDINKKTSVIKLIVGEGLHKPYLYKSKAYRRSDSATIEVDNLELKRLILEGMDSSFEELPAKNQNLEFNVLKEKLQQHLQIQSVTDDILKSLELYKAEIGINKAGELIADNNSFPGIDIVKFGKSINIILDRVTYEKKSILQQYDEALYFYRKNYQYEEIKGALRTTVTQIPEEAYREAVANALVHRTWDINAHINIAMFPDRIEITSPGGLPKGITVDAYTKGGISILRNRIIGNLFFRLQMIERFGTGIRRINDAYGASDKKPKFEISESSIRITLPVIEDESNLSVDEKKVLQIVRNSDVSSSFVAGQAGFGKSKSIKILKKLVDEGYIREIGNGRGHKYTIN
ncbi:ATP-binding protein [Anaerovibrio sp.]|uniref:ATP-binding protein n=1 Tax=Anaerovibrio sp. TaxID=1872532 RepID=UPI0025B9D965|nr:ATP-binding protein [Anaerovibrio sp.]MBR2143298.1 putative DNA binding domain-containing protein [Anaerovibrio sp.]